MSQEHSHHFVPPLKYYVGTFIALLFLTFITVFVAQFHFGSLNIVIAMLVASIKAYLVLSYFMGLKWDDGVNIVVVVSCIVFIGIFLAFTLADVSTRGEFDPVEKGVHNINSPVKIISKDASGNHHH